MEIFFPPQTLSLFQAFAPCFTAPSFAYFQSYMWALMVVEGRKCMTRLAIGFAPYAARSRTFSGSS